MGSNNPKTFFIHSELLAKGSDRLAASVNGNFREKDTRTIELVEEDPELFKYFLVSYLTAAKKKSTILTET